MGVAEEGIRQGDRGDKKNLGAVFARAQRRSFSATSLLLSLDLITNKLEKSVSQRYVVGKGRIRRNAISSRNLDPIFCN